MAVEDQITCLQLHDKNIPPPEENLKLFHITESDNENEESSITAYEGSDSELSEIIDEVMEKPSKRERLMATIIDEHWADALKHAYATHNYPAQYPNEDFEMSRGFLFQHIKAPGYQKKQPRIFIPELVKNGRSLHEAIIAHAHSTLYHPSAETTARHLRCDYTWPTLIKDVTEYDGISRACN